MTEIHTNHENENQKSIIKSHDTKKKIDNSKRKRKTKKKNKKNLFLKTILCSVLVLVIGAGLTGGYIYSQFQPIKTKNDGMIEIEIPRGYSLQKISTMLEEMDVIRNDKAFYYYARYKGESGFQAGTYYFTPGMEIQKVIGQLKEGEVYADSDKFTIPEGFTVDQIATRLADKGIVDKEEFLAAANITDYESAKIQKDIKENKEVRYALEGYLFPETYIVNKDATVKEVLEMMLKQTEEKIPAEWYAQLEKTGLTIQETITLASIIEREARVDDERQKIAGVYINRLKTGMRLQADATVQYALGEQKDRLLYSDLEIESPYNTYKNVGLPPGPIANPGLPSIKAAFFPESHNYLFYVLKKDGMGHNFSEDYAQHLKYVEEAKKE